MSAVLATTGLSVRFGGVRAVDERRRRASRRVSWSG